MRRYYYKLKRFLLHSKLKSESQFLIDYAKYNSLKINSDQLKNFQIEHEFYTTHISNKNMVVSFKAIKVLIRLNTYFKTKNILDLGSGFSTLVFNSIHKNATSVEYNDAWAKKTEKYLLEKQVKSNIIDLNSLKKIVRNLLFLNLNYVEERIKVAKDIFNDVHKDYYLSALLEVFDRKKSYLFKGSTKDEFSRFAMIYVHN